MADPDPPVGRDARALRGVFVATFFVRLGFGITLAVFASYLLQRSTGLSASDYGVAGLVSALAPTGEFATVLLSGAAADRWGRFPVLFAGMAGAATLLGMVSITRSVPLLAGANFLFGVSSGAILAASLAVVGDESASAQRGREMGRFDAMNLSGWVVGYAVGFGAWGSLPNSQLGAVFFAGAVSLAAGLAAAAVIVRDVPTRPVVPEFRIRAALHSAFRPAVLVVTLPWLAIYALIGTALVFLGVSAQGIGVSPKELAIFIAGGGAAFVLTQPFYGRLADRFGRTRLMTVGTAGFVLTMAFAALLLRWGPRWPLLVGIGASILLALGYGPAALAALTDLTAAASRATTMAIYSLTISFGMLVGLVALSSLIGPLGNTGADVFFAGVSAALIALTAIRWRQVRRATIPVR